MNRPEGFAGGDAAHPDDTTLSAWVAGELAAELAEPVEAHLEGCDACARRLDDLEPNDDPLVTRLRGAAGMLDSVHQEPAPPPGETNLLFGAIAMQAGLITAQQFADSSVLWASRGGMPLADLLVEQGWIDESARQSVLGLLAARGEAARGSRPAAETLSGRAAGSAAIGETLMLSPLPSERLRLKQLHSQGGIGQVWRAQDTLLGREVALKELLPELRGSKKHRERFFREARVGAQMSHPGTAPVYEYREEGGRCYYTMKFFSGRTLSESILETHATAASEGVAEESSAPIERLFPLLEHFLSVCDTIAYAHAHGIVHRDLKGENIVLGEYGEVTVIDWGLAKLIEGGSGIVTPGHESSSGSPTLEGERLGTPGYMAPEQARGELSAIDEQTDVYGLAAVLYEVLTTRPPFSGTTANEIMHRVEVELPPPPSLSHPTTPHELEAICLKGLSKLKEDRYPSAAALRDAVRDWLGDQVRQQRESDRQAKFFALSQDLFVSLDDRGAVAQVNPAYERFFGRDGRQSIGKHYLASIHPDDAERAKAIFKKVQRGISQPDAILRVADAEGVYRPVSWTLTRVPGEATIYAVGRPEDEESRQRRLAEERSRFFSLSSDLCVTIDAEYRIRQVNKTWLEVLRYPEERAIGGICLNGFHPDDRSLVKRKIDSMRDGDSVHDTVARSLTVDGEVVPINWTLTRVAGEDLMYGIGRLVDAESEQRRIIEAQSRFFALSPDLFVISDENGHAGQINEAWERTLGWTADDILGKPFHQFCHPDDVPAATRAGRRALLREPVIDLETRVATKEGHYRTIAWTLCRVAGDRVNYAIGRDVTESKRAEERLRAILDSGPEALVVVGGEGEIEFANQVLCRLFGYQREEIEGQRIEALMPEEYRARHQQVFEQFMQAPTVRSMGRGAKFPALRADGTRFAVQISLSPLWLSSGSLSILAALQPDFD